MKMLPLSLLTDLILAQSALAQPSPCPELNGTFLRNGDEEDHGISISMFSASPAIYKVSGLLVRADGRARSAIIANGDLVTIKANCHEGNLQLVSTTDSRKNRVQLELNISKLSEDSIEVESSSPAFQGIYLRKTESNVPDEPLN